MARDGDSESGQLDITTTEGVVRGVDQGATLAWYGIPYAQPPMGSFVFAARLQRLLATRHSSPRRGGHRLSSRRCRSRSAASATQGTGLRTA